MSIPLPDIQRCRLAALNNAKWVNTMSDPDHAPIAEDANLWLHNAETPPYTPNVVTLVPNEIQLNLTAISNLKATLTGSWAVKDSFSQLDLHPLGFRVLFEAEWIWFDTNSLNDKRLADTSSVEWSSVRTEKDLKSWEAVWRTLQDADAPQMFSPRLLGLDGISIISGHETRSTEGDASRIVAGFILCRSQEVIGMSNLFGPLGRETETRASATKYAGDMFPDLPIVDYEHGDALEAARNAGYQSIGPLRVWTC